jgi:Tol biopolymer transport system component
VTDLRSDVQAALGPAYSLERELGGGGMSRVYVAKDIALGRDIVVKVLPRELAAAVSVDRFRREIQLAARLQHPHIVPLLTAGDAVGLPFFTMPFVRGESLRTRLRRGPAIPIDEVVHLLRDVAAALAYAHDEGVVHRDIKPENIILSGGVAVVADFGVAKAVTASTTIGEGDGDLTSVGIALGTPAYMSPEQATGDPNVDHRADIYSFGCVAYELLTGTSPFAGRTPQQMLAAHVTESAPSIVERNATMPPALAELVMRCLQKLPAKRPQTVEELLTALGVIATQRGSVPTTAPLPRVFRPAGRAMAAGLLVLVVAVAAGSWLRSDRDRAPTILSTSPIAVSLAIEIEPAISPDGKTVAFTGWTSRGKRIFVRQVDGERANVLIDSVEASQPRWSPDGSRISFVSDNGIYVVAASGGAPRRLVDAQPGMYGTHSWSPDGRSIVFDREKDLWLQPIGGGAPRLFLRDSATVHLHSPAWSPDGRFIAYVAGWPLALHNVSPNQIWVAPVTGGSRVLVSDSISVNVSPAWARGGQDLVFVSNMGGPRDVYRVGMNAGRPQGKPTLVSAGGVAPFTVSLSADGSRLVYDAVRNSSNIWRVDISRRVPVSWSDATRLTNDRQHVESMKLSHDGQWLTYDSDRAGNMDIYKIRTDGGDPIQLTTAAEGDFGPALSPDGTEIVFQTHRNGWRNLFVMNADGTNVRALTTGAGNKVFADWSADGRRLAYVSPYGISVIQRDARGRWSLPRVVAGGESRWGLPKWSPTSADIASSDSGRLTVIAVDEGRKRVLSTTHRVSQWFEWSGDGSTLFAAVKDHGFWSIWAFPLNSDPPRRILGEDIAHHFGREFFATDGRTLYFTSGEWESDVYLMRLSR